MKHIASVNKVLYNLHIFKDILKNIKQLLCLTLDKFESIAE